MKLQLSAAAAATAHRGCQGSLLKSGYIAETSKACLCNTAEDESMLSSTAKRKRRTRLSGYIYDVSQYLYNAAVPSLIPRYVYICTVTIYYTFERMPYLHSDRFFRKDLLPLFFFCFLAAGFDSDISLRQNNDSLSHGSMVQCIPNSLLSLSVILSLE